MRAAYVNYLPGPGALNKIRGQARAAAELGLPLDIVVLTDRTPPSDKNIHFVPLKSPRGVLRKKWMRNAGRYKRISSSWDLASYDRVILRYPGCFDPSCRKFFKRFGPILLTEHHTRELDELRSLEKGILNPLRVFLEKRNAPKALKGIRGKIFVTEELKQFHFRTVSDDVPAAVISNGIDVGATAFTPSRVFEGKNLALLAVSGSFYSWQGIDRLLRGILDYRGDVAVILRVIGNVVCHGDRKLIGEVNRGPHKVIAPGVLEGKSLNEQYEASHIAVSTLALYRKNMRQACALKTREYISRGIPFVYAYDDPDLTGEEPFALKLENREKSIDIEPIIHFARNISRQKGLSRRMRDFAARKLSWEKKMKEMFEFAVRS